MMRQGSQKLNLGCGTNTLDGWINVDTAMGARLSSFRLLRYFVQRTNIFKNAWPSGIFIHDITRRLPWEDGTIDTIYLSYVLEHLSKSEGIRLTEECYRVLKAEGILRIVVPDLSRIVQRYIEKEIDATMIIQELEVEYLNASDGPLKKLLAPYVRFPHRCMYDGDTLTQLMEQSGFDVTLVQPREGRVADIAALESRESLAAAVIAEGQKPGASRPLPGPCGQ